jgi:hypothetical protein
MFKNGDKITLWTNPEEKTGQSIEFMFFRPSFEDGHTLYTAFKSKLFSYTRSNGIANFDELSEQEKMAGYSEIVNTMFLDKMVFNLIKNCLSRCLIDGLVFNAAVEEDDKAPFADQCMATMIYACVARYGNFTPPHSGQ